VFSQSQKQLQAHLLQLENAINCSNYHKETCDSLHFLYLELAAHTH